MHADLAPHCKIVVFGEVTNLTEVSLDPQLNPANDTLVLIV